MRTLSRVVVSAPRPRPKEQCSVCLTVCEIGKPCPKCGYAPME